MLLQPPAAVPLVHRLHGPPHRVLTGYLGHSQQLWIDTVGPNRVDVGVSPMTGQHRQQQGSQYVPFLGRVRTAVAQRAILHEFIEQPAGLQELDEEYHQPQAAHQGFRHPLYMNLAREGIETGIRLWR